MHGIQQGFGATTTSFLDGLTDAVCITADDWLLCYVNRRGEEILGQPSAMLLGRTIWEVFPHALGAAQAEHYRHARESGNPTRFDLRPLGQHLTVSIYPAATEVVIVLHDAADRQRLAQSLVASEAQRRDLTARVDQQGREIAMLDRLHLSLAHQLDERAIVRAMVAIVSDELQYPQVSVGLLRDNELVGEAHVGLGHRPTTLPVGQGMMGRVARTRRAELVTDVSRDPDFIGDADARGEAICIPLLDGDQLLGVLNVESAGQITLDETDLRLLSMLAEHVGVALGRAQRHTALRWNETRLRSQYQTFPLPTYTWGRQDDDFVLLDYNAAAEVFTEGTIAARVGQTSSVIYAHFPEVRAALDRCWADQTTIRHEVHYHSQGLNRDFDLIVTYLYVAPHFVVMHSEDVTARTAAEAALRASEARLAAAQALAHLGSWEYDHASGELRWSDECFRIGGYAPKSFVPTPQRMLSFVHPDDRELVRAALNVSLERGETYALDHRIVRRNGEVRVVHQQTESVMDADGQLLKRRGTVQDVTERRQLEAQLLHQAFHDPLTGLPNRALFLDRLGHALDRARRSDQHCAVLLLDMDRFKNVNDSLGHGVGDRLLVALSARLRACLRDADTLARLGGDEFAILLEDIADLGEALGTAERLHAASQTALAVDGREMYAPISVGVALRSGSDDTTADLLRFADVALYRAKERGGECTEIFYPGMSVQALELLDMERDLRRAIERDELRVYYQPIIDLATSQVTGLEALLRWQHPTRGLVAPNDFIPLAEKTGLIVPIGGWVLTAACRQVRAWQEAYPEVAVPMLSVNLSARQFRHPDLARDVAAALAETGLAPQHLALEVTETVAMDHAETAIATLEQLHQLGVQIAIDDFGTGYSSLAYLQRLPVDRLKIDRTFFQNVERNRAIVRAVTTLARGLGLAVVAEGLETTDQVRWAREAGCDRGQGFYFAPPLPAAHLTALWQTGLTFSLPDPVLDAATQPATPPLTVR